MKISLNKLKMIIAAFSRIGKNIKKVQGNNQSKRVAGK